MERCARRGYISDAQAALSRLRTRVRRRLASRTRLAKQARYREALNVDEARASFGFSLYSTVMFTHLLTYLLSSESRWNLEVGSSDIYPRPSLGVRHSRHHWECLLARNARTVAYRYQFPAALLPRRARLHWAPAGPAPNVQ